MTPLVSIVMIFLNEEAYIEEAIRSVLAQSYDNWELLLIDDGSSDHSTHIAQSYAARMPTRIRYVDHPQHENKGTSASRNLGMLHARGPYLAFLDADDTWLPEKLATQVPQLEQDRSVGLLYGASLLWRSWNPACAEPDTLYQPTTHPAVFNPPDLLTAFLSNKVLMPCHGSILVRTDVVRDIGGWVDSFTGLYEDQVLFAKLCLTTRVQVGIDCVDRYRQHDDSACAVAYRSGSEKSARTLFFAWLTEHLRQNGLHGTPAFELAHTCLKNLTTVSPRPKPVGAAQTPS